jgi:lantibiotic modifying enzyme
LGCAAKTNEGWSWKSLQRTLPKNLTGLSHGVAGIATALLELYAATGDSRFRDGAFAGLQYERTHFCRDQGNWPDFRKIAYFPAPDKPICLTFWCHGAPGIGLSRLRAWELLERDEEILGEIEIAIGTTKKWFETTRFPDDGDYSLCHGASGNAELLMMAAEVLERTELWAIAEEIGQRGIEQFERNNLPWPCGVAEAGETPNLMLGLAGIGYFYLRLYAPKEAPCILLIRPEGPPASLNLQP